MESIALCCSWLLHLFPMLEALTEMQVGEQELKALGITKCAGLVQHRGLLSALYSEVAVEAFLAAGLGLGRTQHHGALQEGEVGRKGKSVERTFAPIGDQAELEAKVSFPTPSPPPLLIHPLLLFLVPQPYPFVCLEHIGIVVCFANSQTVGGSDADSQNVNVEDENAGAPPFLPVRPGR